MQHFYTPFTVPGSIQTAVYNNIGVPTIIDVPLSAMFMDSALLNAILNCVSLCCSVPVYDPVPAPVQEDVFEEPISEEEINTIEKLIAEDEAERIRKIDQAEMEALAIDEQVNKVFDEQNDINEARREINKFLDEVEEHMEECFNSSPEDDLLSKLMCCSYNINETWKSQKKISDTLKPKERAHNAQLMRELEKWCRLYSDFQRIHKKLLKLNPGFEFDVYIREKMYPDLPEEEVPKLRTYAMYNGMFNKLLRKSNLNC